MSRQRRAAAHARARLQNLHSDCSDDEDTASETEDMANSEVAGVEEFDSSSSDFRDDELDSLAQAAQPNQGAQ